jgi:hypothetical protein
MKQGQRGPRLPSHEARQDARRPEPPSQGDGGRDRRDPSNADRSLTRQRRTLNGSRAGNLGGAKGGKLRAEKAEPERRRDRQNGGDGRLVEA